jgi:hypothetical protein
MGTTTRWHIGPMTLWIHRRDGEWRIAHEEDPSAAPNRIEAGIPGDSSDLSGHPSVTRYALGAGAADTVTLTPQLADRAVVARPDHMLFIPPDTDMNVFVSSPLWVGIAASGRELASFSIDMPAETWFGPSPREGELCYATRTTLRLRWDDGLFRPHRALTSVRVKNRARHALLFEKIKIPVHLLALYVAPDGTLWSQDVTLEADREGDRSPLDIRPGPPVTVEGVEIVSGARESVRDHIRSRALWAWLPGQPGASG